MQAPVNIFVVYAHTDKPVCQKLLLQLRPLADNGEITLWSDHELQPGTLWDEEIRRRMAQSDIVLLLVSADFFASEYIRRVELLTALERQKQGAARLLPVIVRPCGWADIPVLSRLQVLPPEGRPILSKEWDSPDEPYQQVYEGIKAVVREMRNGQKEKAAVLPPAQVASRAPGPHRWGRWMVAAVLFPLFVIGALKWAPGLRPAGGNLSASIPADSMTLATKQEGTTAPASPVSVPESEKNNNKNTGPKEKPLEGKNASPDPAQRSRRSPTGMPEDTLSKASDLSLFDRKLETVEGMTRIVKGRQQSFLDDAGHWIGAWFDDAENFHEGIAFVKLKNRYFWIDKVGRCVKGCD